MKFLISLALLFLFTCGQAQARPEFFDNDKYKSFHYIFGAPQIVDKDKFEWTPPEDEYKRPGITILNRPGFVVGYYEKYKVPEWVSMRWTRYDFQKSYADKDRKYHEDFDLPWYTRAKPWLGGDQGNYHHGHMAMHLDNSAYGQKNLYDYGLRMTNLCPQEGDLNSKEWLQLEKKHHNLVSSGQIKTIWIIDGPIYEKNTSPKWIAGDIRIRIPDSFYKIIAWFDSSKKLHAVAYIFDNKVEKVNLKDRIFPIKTIEEKTGLNFFPYAEDTDYHRELEAKAQLAPWD